MRPFGRYVIADVDAVGGVPILTGAVMDADLLPGECLTPGNKG